MAAGLWLPQVRQGFDYTDWLALERVKRQVRFRVRKYRDHPALLMWIVGNEVALGRRDDAAVYKGINEIARMVKEIDP